MTGAVFCGLLTAALYSANAQEEGEIDVPDNQLTGLNNKVDHKAPQVQSGGQSVNGKKENGDGKTIDLRVGGEQMTNVFGGAGLDGANTNLISIAFEDVPLQDVVSMFTQISGANIITSGRYTNLFVTANLKDVDWKSALKRVLFSVNMSLLDDYSGILTVVPSEIYKQKFQQIEEDKPLVTKTFTLKYLSAVDLIEQIKLLKLLSSRGTIITSQSKEQDKISLKSTGNQTDKPAQNPSVTTAIIVSDIKEYIDKVEALIVRLDRREPQVFIEARVIDVSITFNEKVGIDWSMLDSFGLSASLKDASWSYSDDSSDTDSSVNRNYQYDKRNNTDGLNQRYDIHGQQYEESTTTYEESPPGSGNWIANTVVTPTRTISDTINTGQEITSDKSSSALDTVAKKLSGSVVLNTSDVALYLSALKTTGNADVLSHPVLIVGNRVEAKIHVGEQTWKVSLKRDTTNTGSAPMDRYSEDAAAVDLGLKLWVIPEIDVANDCVRMTVDQEMTEWVKDITTAQGSVYPVISTRRLSTRVSIPSFHTVVIGGLIENRKSKKVKKVPLLGDIPLLGYLFTHTEDVDEKHNLIIMLTTTILDDRKPVTGMEAIAQLTVNKFEQTPLAPVKNEPTNQVFVQSPSTNVDLSFSGSVSSASVSAAPTAAGNGVKPVFVVSTNQASAILPSD